jgi:hypothetical protein
MTSLENGVLKVLQDRFLLTVPTCSHAGAEDASPWLWIPVVMDPRGYGSPWLWITVVIDHWQATPRSGPLPHAKVFIQAGARPKLHFGRTFILKSDNRLTTTRKSEGMSGWQGP